MEIDIIIWSDDLAVPTITEKAVDLVPALLRLLDFVLAEFAQRGFQLNLAKGKTGVVATYCGSEAASMRRQYQLIPQPGTIFEFQDGALQFVHVTPSYRHLGTLYTSDQTLDTEISHRVGMARSAFEQIRRRLLTNKHLPLKLRLQLFGSLVLSKLFFAAGSWHTPTGRQLDKIRAAMVRMVKSIYGITVRHHSALALLSPLTCTSWHPGASSTAGSGTTAVCATALPSWSCIPSTRDSCRSMTTSMCVADRTSARLAMATWS